MTSIPPGPNQPSFASVVQQDVNHSRLKSILPNFPYYRSSKELTIKLDLSEHKGDRLSIEAELSPLSTLDPNFSFVWLKNFDLEISFSDPKIWEDVFSNGLVISGIKVPLKKGIFAREKIQSVKINNISYAHSTHDDVLKKLSEYLSSFGNVLFVVQQRNHIGVPTSSAWAWLILHKDENGSQIADPNTFPTTHDFHSSDSNFIWAGTNFRCFKCNNPIHSSKDCKTAPQKRALYNHDYHTNNTVSNNVIPLNMSNKSIPSRS